MTTENAGGKQGRPTTATPAAAAGTQAAVRRARAQIAERFRLTHIIRTASLGMMVQRTDEG